MPTKQLVINGKCDTSLLCLCFKEKYNVHIRKVLKSRFDKQECQAMNLSKEYERHPFMFVELYYKEESDFQELEKFIDQFFLDQENLLFTYFYGYRCISEK